MGASQICGGVLHVPVTYRASLITEDRRSVKRIGVGKEGNGVPLRPADIAQKDRSAKEPSDTKLITKVRRRAKSPSTGISDRFGRLVYPRNNIDSVEVIAEILLELIVDNRVDVV